MPARFGSTASQQLLEDVLVQNPRAVCIGVGQCGARRRRDPQVRQAAFTAGEPAADLAQRLRAPQLAEQHRHELPPTRKAARMALSAGGTDDALELVTGKELEQLIEDAAESEHGAALLGWVSRTVRRPRHPTPESAAPLLSLTR